MPFADHGQFYYEDKFCRVWGSLFSCVSHGPFALQEEEVSEVCWLTPEEITARCDEFTPDSLKALALWMTRNAGNEYDDANKDRKRATAIVARLLTTKRQPFGCLLL